MPLIIEDYYHPYTLISERLFPGVEFTLLDHPVCDPDGYYYTREEIARPIRYYFLKVYQIEDNRIVCIDKKARQRKYFDLDTGKQILFQKIEIAPELDKTVFLPQLDAQRGDHVLFPDDDEE